MYTLQTRSASEKCVSPLCTLTTTDNIVGDGTRYVPWTRDMMTTVIYCVLASGSIAQCVGYALSAPAPPFPVLVLAFTLNGFGIALQVSAKSTSID